MYYQKINQKIIEFISIYGTEPTQIIMNTDDFIEFKEIHENNVHVEVIDIEAKVKYMGKEIIRTSNLKKGEIYVGFFK